MKIVLVQLDIVWGNPEANIRRAESLISSYSDVDLFVLPEMWATGFVVQPEAIAESENASVSLAWMRKVTLTHGCAICGSLAVKTVDGTFRNRHYFVTPDKVYYYDKHHLFSHGHEDETYTAGNTHTLVEWRDFKFLLLTCYDLRFPVWSRYGWAGEYDAIILVANWPKSRMAAWDVLLHARAIENQCFVIAVNRVGEDPVSHYAGGSVLIDPIGRTLAVCNNNAEQSLEALLSMEDLLNARKHFRVLSDRDTLAVKKNLSYGISCYNGQSHDDSNQYEYS